MEARLILEDGMVFVGDSIGSTRTSVSEIVFNTSMTGYLEVLTDPSYAGQAITMTYPLIGNYGVTPDRESERIWADGYIVRELSRSSSNFRRERELSEVLKEEDIPGICHIDTRALTKRLRDKGTMNGMITTEAMTVEEALPKIRAYRVGDVVSKVTCETVKTLKGTAHFDSGLPQAIVKGTSGGGNGTTYRVALLDLGAKKSITAALLRRGCEVLVYPAHTPASTILAARPDGIMLSNGPGDPKDCGTIIEQVKLLYESNVPIFAICLGHQLMALANGGNTYKMKYGHRGGNHPVKDLQTGRVYISSQNHGYVVDPDSLSEKVAIPSFVNVNDGTNEGLEYRGKRIFTVQFHPEAAPGPLDSGVLFDRFIDMMRQGVQGR